MRKKLFGLFAFILCLSLTGCGNGGFTITCTTEKENLSGVESQSVITYTFDKDQYATKFNLNTSQKFDDKETYEYYKTAQEEALQNNDDKDVTYSLKSNDKKLTLDYTISYKINKEDAPSEEDLEDIKAINVLKKSEADNQTCKIKGISRDKIK